MNQHVSPPERILTFAERRDRSSESIPPAKETPAGRRRSRLRPLLLTVAGVALLAAGGYYGHYWWNVGRFLVSTDDAYLQADNVIVSPKVSGYISDVLVGDNQPVKAGQVLARIDDSDYRTALAAARANVDEIGRAHV